MSATIKITPSPGATDYRVTYGPTDPPAEGSTVIPVGSMTVEDDKLSVLVPGIQPGHFVQVEAGNAYGYSSPIQGQALIAVALTSPEEAAVLKEEETVVIQGTSTGGLVDLEFTIDNEIWLPIAEDVDASTGTFSYEWTAVPLVIAIRAETEGLTDMVNVTTVPQSAPVITFISTPDAIVGQDYTAEVSITDADGDLIPPLAADATLNGVAADSVSNVGDVYSFTWLAASLPVEGTGYVLAVVADDEGNRTASESTTVDVVAEPASSLLDGLVSWWNLDEESGTRYDAHGENHLTDVNTVGFVAGKYGNAARFTPADSDKLEKENNPSISLSSGSLTVAFWVKSNVDAPSCRFIGKIGEWYFQFLGTSFRLYVQDTVDGNSIAVNTAPTPITITAGEWNLVIARIANGSFSSVYFNNTLFSGTTQRTMSGSTNPLSIGRLQDSLDGAIDNLGIWNRLLTDEECTRLWNSGTGLSYADLIGV